ncbi:hypothetical protein OG738_09425 [Amycolatopsis sp. NBC_01488]|uniref:hypothetical protein n=1 Tax=Amycolatopsis sp. NBC_01488 TaxID=2903563 RepID=UPI002E2BFAA6|nr:hypothetical protein [Amycolatopsis sp. NBC_01488]
MPGHGDNSAETAISPRGAAPTPGPRCGYCGSPCRAASTHGALVADSSVIDPVDLARDGRRFVVACSAGHLKSLVDRARATWAAEELWFGQLCRASRQHGMRDAEVREIGLRARLSAANVRAALAWNATRDQPTLILPGGQIVPLPAKQLVGRPRKRRSHR